MGEVLDSRERKRVAKLRQSAPLYRHLLQAGEDTSEVSFAVNRIELGLVKHRGNGSIKKRGDESRNLELVLDCGSR